MAPEETDHSKKGRKKAPKPPDGGWGWWVVAASFLIHVVADGVAYAFGLFFVYIIDDFHSNRSATSWITAILAGMTYGSGPVAGALVNKFGCRATAIIGSFVAAFGFAISYYAPNVQFLYVSIGLVGGLGLGLIYLPAIVSVTTYFDKRRAFATGIAVCGSGFGTALMTRIIEFLVRQFQWRLSLVITGGIIASCFIFSCFFKPIPQEDAREDEEIRENFQSGSTQTETELLDKQLLSQSSLETIKGPTVSTSHPNLNLARGSIGATQIPPNANGFRKRHSHPHNLRDMEPCGSGLITQRKDIFYSGSVDKLPHTTLAKSQRESQPSLNHTSTTKPQGNYEDQEKKKSCCGCLHCSPEIKEAFLSMTDFTILEDPIFLLLAISNFFTMIGYNIPYTYLVDLAIGSDPAHPIHSIADASFLIEIVGYSNTVSRVVLGYLSDKSWMNRLYLYNGALTVCGIGVAVTPHVLMDINMLQVCSGVFGGTIAVYVSLTSVLLVDLLGLEKLTHAFGLLLVFQGLASIIGPPVVGALFDHFNNHKYGFGLAGAMIIISGLMLFIIPLIQRRERMRAPSTAEASISAAEERNE